LVLLTGVSLRITDMNPAVAQTRSIMAWKVPESPSLDPEAPVWDELRSTSIPLTAQQRTVPTGGGTVPSVRVKAAHHDDTLYLLVEWTDITLDDTSDTVEHFSDAAAIQIPAEHGSTVPEVCMGQADSSVNIWQWRADSQRGFDRLGPGSEFVDGYPSTDDLFYPALAAGNPFAQASAVTTQNLVASGFGTLEQADSGVVLGAGIFDGSQWRVVFARQFSASDAFQPTFDEGREFDVTFAVWNGSQGDRDGQKSVSEFVRLEVADRAIATAPSEPADERSTNALPWILTGLAALGVYVLFTLLVPGPEQPEGDIE
jgi:complex iron-sulfur molybdoenzyme family reductase subunit gamma